MSLRVVRLGSPRTKGEGTRIGIVRRPPRGVPKSEFSSRDYYDVWLPELAPSEELRKQAKDSLTPGEWRRFVRMYRSEMAAPERARLLDLIAALSHGGDFSVGCYCEDESRCHRSVLRELLVERGARLAV